jgi:hypothetical protein
VAGSGTFAGLDLHAADDVSVQPGVGRNFLVEEVGEPAGADDHGILGLVGMLEDGSLQRAHEQVQQKLRDVASNKELTHQQTRVLFTMLGEEAQDEEERERCGPGLEQRVDLAGEVGVAAVDSVVVVDDRQRAHQQQDHDGVFGGQLADVVIDQPVGDTKYGQAVKTGLNGIADAAAALEDGAPCSGSQKHVKPQNGATRPDSRAKPLRS